MWWKSFLHLFLVPAVSCGVRLRVVSTNSSAELAQRTGGAEVLNSSLHHSPELTLCTRFQTYQFTSPPGHYPIQVVLHLNIRLTLLACFVAVPCSVEGSEDCTGEMKGIQSSVPGGWRQGKVFGLSQSGDWERYISYPAWQPHTWNTACVTLSGPGGYYQAVSSTLIGPAPMRLSSHWS